MTESRLKKKRTSAKSKKKEAEPAKIGRPVIEIDWDEVDRMCEIQCTISEIAHILGVHRHTLDNRCKDEHGISFSTYFKEKQDFGKERLRRALWKKAISGQDTRAQIFLSQNILGMSTKSESKTESKTVIEDRRKKAVKKLMSTPEGRKAYREVHALMGNALEEGGGEPH